MHQIAQFNLSFIGWFALVNWDYNVIDDIFKILYFDTEHLSNH